jgi:hypothetical protein
VVVVQIVVDFLWYRFSTRANKWELYFVKVLKVVTSGFLQSNNRYKMQLIQVLKLKKLFLFSVNMIQNYTKSLIKLILTLCFLQRRRSLATLWEKKKIVFCKINMMEVILKMKVRGTWNMILLFCAIRMLWPINIWSITLMLTIWNIFSINRLTA